jgi:tubulin-specific chaperone D
MAFYYESTDLGLKKNLTSLLYEDLPAVKADFALDVEYQSDAQIPEKDILLRDVHNICLYFYSKGCLGKDHKQFPLDQVKNRFCHILEKYQEQSSLLDSLLEPMVSPLANVVKAYIHHKVQGVLSTGGSLDLESEFHTVCDALYIVAKVRGVRHISKYFPHEVRDLEPVVYVL